MHREDLAALLAEAEAAGKQGRWQEVRRMLAAVREELPRAPRGLLLLADACCQLDDLEQARSAADEALARFREAGDDEGAMKAKNLLGVALFHAGSLDAARVWFRGALALAMALGADRMRADLANNLGAICDLTGEREQALLYYHQALRGYEELGSLPGQARARHNLGIAHRDLGQCSAAEDSFARAAELAEAAGDPVLFAFARVAEAEMVVRRGDLEGAEQRIRQALPRFDIAASLHGLIEVHKLRGMIAGKRGDLETARGHLDTAVDFGEMHGVPLLDAEVRAERGAVLCAIGEVRAGIEDLARAAEAFHSLHARHRAEEVRATLERVASPAASPVLRVA